MPSRFAAYRKVETEKYLFLFSTASVFWAAPQLSLHSCCFTEPKEDVRNASCAVFPH